MTGWEAVQSLKGRKQAEGGREGGKKGAIKPLGNTSHEEGSKKYLKKMIDTNDFSLFYL